MSRSVDTSKNVGKVLAQSRRVETDAKKLGKLYTNPRPTLTPSIINLKNSNIIKNASVVVMQLKVTSILLFVCADVEEKVIKCARKYADVAMLEREECKFFTLEFINQTFNNFRTRKMLDETLGADECSSHVHTVNSNATFDLIIADHEGSKIRHESSLHGIYDTLIW